MKKLIIIGANYLQLPLIQKAGKMGIETHVFAWEQGAVGKDFCDFFYPISILEKEKILQIARDIHPDGVTSIGSDLAIITVNYIASELGLVGNSMAVTEQTTNKYLMRQNLRDGGLPCPKFSRCCSIKEADSLQLSYPVIVKPTDRSGSRGVTKITSSEDLHAAIERALQESFGKEVLIEEFVEGREISVEMISFQGVHYPLAITDKITTGAPYFVELAHHQPAVLDSGQEDKIFSLVQNALECLGVQNGASHSELFMTPEGKAVFVEIGARMGGDCIGSDLVELSTGYDFVKGVIDIALDRFVDVKKTKTAYSGIYYISHVPGTVMRVDDRTGNYPQVVKKEVNVKPGDQLKPLMESSDRVGYYIYADTQRFVTDAELIQVVTE